MRIMPAAVTLALTLIAPVAAQTSEQTVTAREPAGIVIAMLNAGYDAALTTDDAGDPLIDSEMAGMPTHVYFYDCDEQTHDKCGSVQLVVGFDRAKPWKASDAVAFAKKYRFAAVSLDEEGDPFITWDIVTDDGIPTRVFVKSLRRFEETVRLADEAVFAEERAND